MHGDEHVGARDARAADAVAQLQKLVAVARQHGAHARLRVDALGERARDGERHVLLARATVADGARVLAAVSRVHRDDDVTAAVTGACKACTALRCRAHRRAADRVPRISSSVRPRGAMAQWAWHASVLSLDHDPQRAARLRPKRTALTAPAGAGACTPAAGAYAGRSMTTRWGFSSVKNFGTAALVEIERELRGAGSRRELHRPQLRGGVPPGMARPHSCDEGPPTKKSF